MNYLFKILQEKRILSVKYSNGLGVLLVFGVSHIKTHQTHNHVLHITGNTNRDTIWDFIRDVFEFNHTTNKNWAKAHDVYPYSSL